MRTLPISVVALSLLLLSGCSRYDMREDKQGRMIRVDRLTGEVTIVEGDKIIKAKTPEEQAAEKRKLDELARPRYLNSVSLPAIGGGIATIALSWREGRMYYRFQVMPVSKQVQAARGRFQTEFHILLYDGDGFQIDKIVVHTIDLTGNVDDNGRLDMLSSEGVEPVSEDDFRRITDWNVSWSGFGPH